MASKTLGALTDEDLDLCPAWYVVDEAADEADVSLAPVRLDGTGRIPATVGQVWCSCIATFADGSRHKASAMCRGNASEGPLLWTFSTGAAWVCLIVPPTPDFVLEQHGPVPFAAAFGRPPESVFPLRIEVLQEFAFAPHKRIAVIGADGVLATTDSA